MWVHVWEDGIVKNEIEGEKERKVNSIPRRDSVWKYRPSVLKRQSVKFRDILLNIETVWNIDKECKI